MPNQKPPNHTLPDSPQAVGRPMLLLAMVVVGGAFFAAEQDMRRSRDVLAEANAEDAAEEMAANVTTGSSSRQIAYPLLGALGLFFLVRREGGPRPNLDAAGAMVLLCLGLCAASLCWSADPGLTIKRTGILVFCFLGALGLARQFPVRQLCLFALCLAAGYVAFGVAAEIMLGTFRPWSADYRFAGTVHPNTQGVHCAALCLAAVCLAVDGGPKKRLFITLLVFAAVMLLLTKSRASLGALLVSLGMLWVWTGTRERTLGTVLGLVAAVSGLLLVACSVGGPFERRIMDMIFLGRMDGVETLTGRVPLWTELWTYLRERPLLGFGYDAFWNPERIEGVSSAAGWGVHASHSIYLEMAVSVGLIGAAAVLSVVLLGMARLGPLCRRKVSGAYCFFFGLLAFGLAHGLLESEFVKPTFVPFLAACGLMQVIFFRAEPATDAWPISLQPRRDRASFRLNRRASQ